MIRSFLTIVGLLLALSATQAQNTQIREFQQPVQLTTIEWSGQHLLMGGSTDTTSQSDFLLIRQDTSLQILSTIAYPDPGDAGKDEMKFVRQAQNGGLLLAGTGNDATPGFSSIKLIRTNPQGTVLWARKFTAPSPYVIRDLTGMDCYGDGAAVVACVLHQPVTGDNFGHTIKLTPAGAVQWTHTAALQDPSIQGNLNFVAPSSNVVVQGPDTVWIAWNRTDTLSGNYVPVIPIYAGTASVPPGGPVWTYTNQEADYLTEIQLADPVNHKLTMLCTEHFSSFGYVHLIQCSSSFLAEKGLLYQHNAQTFIGKLGGGGDFYENTGVFVRFTGTLNIIRRNHQNYFPPVQDFVSEQDKVYAISRGDNYYNANNLILSFNWQGTPGCSMTDTAYDYPQIVLPPPPQYFPPDPLAPVIQLQTTTIFPTATSLTLSHSLLCDGDELIWPGDVDDNGTANSVDVLYLGVAWGANGSLRPNGSTAWTGQSAGANWGPQFSNFIDWKYADCDADGTVGQADIQVISQNYGLIHNRNGAERTLDGPPLYLSIPVDSVMVGDTLMADVFLGTPLDTADQLYGIAFTITYDTALVQAGSAAFIPDSTWFGEQGVNTAYLSKDFYDLGQVEAALTRTDQQMVNGQGRIGSFMIITIDNISGKTVESRQLNLSIVPRLAMNLNQDSLSIEATEGDSLVVFQEIINSQSPRSDLDLRIYPQPADQEVVITCSQRIESVQLLTLHGQILLETRPGGTQTRVPLEGIAPGTYILRVQSPAGLMQQMLVQVY
ncbi:MAG: T9SS type A sorting domain-containing protein [Bacteroidia bacterium]|nr:T9SS type A sorting domain-containing protein [Bacteroidia bacterium]